MNGRCVRIHQSDTLICSATVLSSANQEPYSGESVTVVPNPSSEPNTTDNYEDPNVFGVSGRRCAIAVEWFRRTWYLVPRVGN